MNAHLIEARCGEYEPSFRPVGVWTDEDEAKSEAFRLNAVAAAYMEARREIGDGPSTKIPDAEWEPLHDAWEKRVNDLVDKHRAMGDDQLDRHDETTYHVRPVPLHSSSEAPQESKLHPECKRLGCQWFPTED